MLRVSKFCRNFSSFTKDSIKIRKATIVDYDAVMSIRDSKTLYGGYDNLTDRYKLLLACPTNTGYVATHDDKVIGFMLSILVNGNNTACLYGHRICKNYTGLSVSSQIYQHIFSGREIRGIIPPRWSFCLDTTMRLAPYIQRYTDKNDLFIPMVIHPYMSTRETMLTFLGASEIIIQSSKHLDGEDMSFLFRSNDLCRTLFPDGRIINLWNLYKPMLENIPLLMDSRTTIIGSNLDKEDLALLSIGTFSHTYRGILYNLNLFGNLNACLDEHVYLHAKALSVNTTLNITFEITIRQNLCDFPTDGIMKSLGFQRPKEYGNYEMFCYEGDHSAICY